MDEPRSANSTASRFPRMGVALIVLLLLGTIAYSGYARARRYRQMKTCQENLAKIDGAKEQWALENNKTPGEPVTELDLAPTDGGCYYRPVPKCPFENRTYVLNPIGTDPVCTSGLPGHSLSPICGIITQLEEWPMEEATVNQSDPKPTRIGKASRIGVAIIVLLFMGVVGYSGFTRAREKRWTQECQEWLTKCDGVKEQWALENNKPAGTVFTERDAEAASVGGCGGRTMPKQCPSGRGKYKLNPIGSDPICTSGIPGHSLSEVGVAITQLEP